MALTLMSQTMDFENILTLPGSLQKVLLSRPAVCLDARQQHIQKATHVCVDKASLSYDNVTFNQHTQCQLNGI